MIFYTKVPVAEGKRKRRMMRNLNLPRICPREQNCINNKKMVDQQGLEPRTNRLWAGCSNQLSYWSLFATNRIILNYTVFVKCFLHKKNNNI